MNPSRPSSPISPNGNRSPTTPSHRLSRISNNNSDKSPSWIVAAAKERLKVGQSRETVSPISATYNSSPITLPNSLESGGPLRSPPISPFDKTGISVGSAGTSPRLMPESPFSSGTTKSSPFSAIYRQSIYGNQSGVDSHTTFQLRSPHESLITMPSQFKSNTMMVNQRSPSGSSSPVKGVTGGAALPLNSSSGASTLQTPAPTQYKPLTSLALKDGWALEEFTDERYNRLRKALFQLLTQEIDYPLLVPYELAAQSK